MTISSQNRKAGPFIGNDVTVDLPFEFKVFSVNDMYVVRLNDATKVETELTLTTDYTVTLNSDQNTDPGGVVSLTAPLASGFTAVVSSRVGYLQPTDITNQGGFYPRVVTSALDRLTILCQQLKEEVDRSAKLPITSTASDLEQVALDIVRLADSADNIDALADIIAQIIIVAGIPTEVVNVSGIAPDVAWASQNRERVVSVADNMADVATVAGNIGNVNVTAGNSAYITALGADLSAGMVALDYGDLGENQTLPTPTGAIRAVYDNRENITTVSNNIADVITVAGVAANVSAVAAVDGEVVQVATIDGEVATVAGIAPSVSAVAANQTLIAALGTDLTGGPITLDYGDLGENQNPATPVGVLGTIYAIVAQIVTVANNSANVTTVGTNIASVNTAATNIAAIIDAPNQATIATTQAGIATTQAGIATSGANAAGSAQIAAEQARDQTLAAFDSFDDRYLGPKAADPATDNDGNPLVPGALYYNTVAPEMRVWEGSMWVAAYASLSGALLKANNLSDLQSAATARTNLGLGSLAVKNSISATDLAANFDLGSIV